MGRIQGEFALSHHAEVEASSYPAPMTVLPPKLSPPALQQNVVPTRVIKRMGRPEHYCGHWLVAGPGAGKTQAARLWVEQVGRPYAWLQLDLQDNDPLVLLEQLRLALQPLVQDQLKLPRYAPQSGVSLQRHCEFLWQMLLDALRTPSIIVLDDAHHIVNWREHPVLDSLMDGLDSRAHLLVLSRSDMDDHYVREVINRRFKRIGPETFAWHPPQLRAWLHRRWGISQLEDPTADALLSISDGRAAILALLDIEALLQDPSSLRQQAAKQLELSELMESSLLASLAPDEREALFYLACLGSFPNRWLCTLGFPLAVQNCVALWQQHASVVHSLDKDPGELRFHPLFAEILRGMSHGSHISNAALRNRLIDACVTKGRALDAIALCRQTGCWDKYWELLQGVGLAWIEQGKLASLTSALSDLPPLALEQFAGPTLSLFQAATVLVQDPSAAYRLALRAMHQSHDRPKLHRVWVHAMALTAQAVVASGLPLGHLAPVVDAMEHAINSPWFLDLSPPLRLLGLGAGMIASIAGQDRPGTELLYQETQRALQACENIDLQSATVSALSRVLLLHGHPDYVDAVEMHIRRLEHLAQTPAAQSSLLHAKVHSAQARGSYAIAENYARTLWNGRTPQTPLIWISETVASGAFCAAGCQKLDRVKLYLQQLSKLRDLSQDSSTNFRLHYYMYKSCLHAHDRQWEQAQENYTLAVHASDEYQYSLMQVCARSCLAVVLLERDEIEAAKRVLEEMESLLQTANLPLSRRVYLSTKAFFATRHRPVEQAKAVVLDLLEQMQATNQYLLVIGMLPQYAELLGFALTHALKPDLVRDIIRRGPIFPKTRPHPKWPSYIEVQTLGRFEIRINGEDARSKLISSGRRFELLTALLWCGGKQLSYDQCIAWIWHHIPDRARAVRSIKTALKRLNDDLGRDDAILDEQEQLSLNPELWSYDAATLGPSADPKALRALASQAQRGFIGPTPIPPGMREVVPTLGAIDLGPKPLLEHFDLDRGAPA